MAAQRGKDILLKIEGGDGAFTTVAGLSWWCSRPCCEAAARMIWPGTWPARPWIRVRPRKRWRWRSPRRRDEDAVGHDVAHRTVAGTRAGGVLAAFVEGVADADSGISRTTADGTWRPGRIEGGLA